MTIVMGLDQHRAQITGEWLDTDTGEVARTRIAPADRQGVCKFLGRFGGQELEVALEATTGWRFVVAELDRVGAVVHLNEPAETAGLRGPKKRAKNDLLMPGICGSCYRPGGYRSRGSRPITSLISAPGSGCGTRCLSSARSGSSGSRRRCITTVARSAGS
ncbi:MAG: hypothetical protein ACRDL5_05510 [Solirubrobacteraceae bacterium]